MGWEQLLQPPETFIGIYDMSGGAADYLMSNMSSDGSFSVANAGTWTAEVYPLAKYYDKYSYGTTSNDAAAYKRGKLGDATKEVVNSVGLVGSFNGGWYTDFSNLLYSNFPWLVRGGRGGSDSGVFAFDTYWGSAISSIGSRVALIVEP